MSIYEDDDYEFEKDELEDLIELPVPRFKAGDRIRRLDNGLAGTVMEDPQVTSPEQTIWYFVHMDNGVDEITQERSLDYETDIPFEGGPMETGWKLDPTGDLWPDTLPWDEAEQNYYRTAAMDPVFVDFVANALRRWRPDEVKQNLLDLGVKYTPEEIDQALVEGQARLAEQKAELYRLREQLEEERRRQEEEEPSEAWEELRWGYNRNKKEWWVTNTHSGIIHPKMLQFWIEDEGTWSDRQIDRITQGTGDLYEEIGERYLFGYSSYNTVSGNIEHQTDASYDLAEISELTDEELKDLDKICRLFVNWPEWNKPGSNIRQKVSEFQPQIMELDAPASRGIWLYSVDDNLLVLANFNKYHRDIIEEIWGHEMEDRDYGKNFYAGMWTDPEDISCVFGASPVIVKKLLRVIQPIAKEWAERWAEGSNTYSSLWKRSIAVPAEYRDDDPLDLTGKKPLIEAMNTEWWTLDEVEQKQAIINAFRATMLSPRMNLKSNAILYQMLMSVPADESNPDVFEKIVRDTKQKWDAQGQMGLEQNPEDVFAVDEILPGKFLPGFWGNVRRLANLGPYADEIWRAASEDMQAGGKGDIFRQRILELNIPGVGPKVASFAWLALAPMTSELATIDVHMMKHLDEEDESPKNPQHYFDLEERLRQERNEMYGEDTPLSWYQWGVWDKRRTPGYHQDHTPLKAYNPTDFREVAWPAPVIPKRKKVKEEDPNQLRFASTEPLVAEEDGWTLYWWRDTDAISFTGMDWRNPLFIDKDEQKIFIGPQNSYHQRLVELMSGDWPEEHGNTWVNQRNRELGVDDWIAGFVENRSPNEIKLWNVFSDSEEVKLTNIVRRLWWKAQNQDKMSKVSSPISDYQWYPLTPFELEGYHNIPRNEKRGWRRRADRQNARARFLGRSGRVHSNELWAVAQRFENKCAYCRKPLVWGTPDATLDHVVPLALGGESVISNIVPSCVNCNQELNNWDARNNPEAYSPQNRYYYLPEEFREDEEKVGAITFPEGHEPSMYRVGDPVIYHGDWMKLNVDAPQGIVVDVSKSEGGFDWIYTVRWADGSFTKDYEYMLLPDALSGNIFDRAEETTAWPDTLPWDEDEQDYYRQATATRIEEVNSDEVYKADAVFKDSPSRRVPFFYSPKRDTIYVGSMDSHHLHLIEAVYSEDEEEMYEIEDEPGNLGVILPNKILYWGEPQDQVVRAMQEKYPNYEQNINWDEFKEDLRYSSSDWKVLKNLNPGFVLQEYEPTKLYKFQDYGIELEDGYHTATCHGMVYAGTWENPKVWYGDAEFDYLFKDKETEEFIRLPQKELNEMLDDGRIWHIPDPNSYITEWSDVETQALRKSLNTPYNPIPTEEIPDTLPWGESEQNYYRKSSAWTVQEVDTSGTRIYNWRWGNEQRPLIIDPINKRIYMGNPNDHHKELLFAALGEDSWPDKIITDTLESNGELWVGNKEEYSKAIFEYLDSKKNKFSCHYCDEKRAGYWPIVASEIDPVGQIMGLCEVHYIKMKQGILGVKELWADE